MNEELKTRCEIYTEMNIQFEDFWVVTTCSDAVGYQRFGGPGCIHLQDDMIEYSLFCETKYLRISQR